jgi:hypothetical protein
VYNNSVMNAMNECDLIKKCLYEGGILNTSHKRSIYLQKNFQYVLRESVYIDIDG